VGVLTNRGDKNMSKKKVLLIVASKGFQPVQYQEPKQVLDDAGFAVITASDQGSIAVANNGFETIVDYTLEYVKVGDYDGIFVIGGPGALEYLDDASAYRIVIEAKQCGIPFGAICSGTRVLSHAGVLNGVRATGWNGDAKAKADFEDGGAEYDSDDLVVDGKVITAVGSTAANDFGNAIVSMLTT
jgi:putative intracellular protease/amidase